MPTKRNQGFTLVELLVVIGIIAILAGIVLAAVSASKEKARQTVCLSNLSQIGKAMAMYQQDNDGFYVAESYEPYKIGDAKQQTGDYLVWLEVLTPYLKSEAIACPSRPDVDVHSFSLARVSGYGYNGLLQNGEPIDQTKKLYRSVGIHESIVKYPSVTVVAGDMRVGLISAFFPDTDNYPFGLLFLSELNQGSNLAGQSFGATRHSGGANYVFADGHAKWFPPKAFEGAFDGKHPSFSLGSTH